MTMHNPFQPIEKIKTEVFMSMPDKYRKKSRTSWSDPNRQGAEVECFLEGPSFDRDGNLWFVDIPFGRIFRIDTKGNWDLVTQYDGWPNGLKFHQDGRAFICDYKAGLLALDPKTGKIIKNNTIGGHNTYLQQWDADNTGYLEGEDVKRDSGGGIARIVMQQITPIKS